MVLPKAVVSAAVAPGGIAVSRITGPRISIAVAGIAVRAIAVGAIAIRAVAIGIWRVAVAVARVGIAVGIWRIAIAVRRMADADVDLSSGRRCGHGRGGDHGRSDEKPAHEQFLYLTRENPVLRDSYAKNAGDRRRFR